MNEINTKWKRLYFIQRFLKNDLDKKVLYVHIPFCKSKCKYCVYSSVVPESSDVIERFVHEILPQQINQYQDIFNQTDFDQVYFGGGTPSILAPEQMEFLFELIPGFHGIEKKCMEASPTTLTSSHINVLKKNDFNFISIGIQTLNNSTLRKYNRPSIAKPELKRLCREINENDLFLNLDFISFLDKGDIRDLPEIEVDLRYILDNCAPSSITIHQYYQSFFTTEKTYYLMEVLKKVLKDYPNYECANSPVEMEDDEIRRDTMLQAEYRLVKKEKREFSHYMWGKYASLPIYGYDILSIGYTNKCNTTSNVKNLVYIASTDKLVYSAEST